MSMEADIALALRLADAAGDELSGLRTEVEDEDQFFLPGNERSAIRAGGIRSVLRRGHGNCQSESGPGVDRETHRVSDASRR